jgi:hypothetical protein
MSTTRQRLSRSWPIKIPTDRPYRYRFRLSPPFYRTTTARDTYSVGPFGFFYQPGQFRPVLPGILFLCGHLCPADAILGSHIDGLYVDDHGTRRILYRSSMHTYAPNNNNRDLVNRTRGSAPQPWGQRLKKKAFRPFRVLS